MFISLKDYFLFSRFREPLSLNITDDPQNNTNDEAQSGNKDENSASTTLSSRSWFESWADSIGAVFFLPSNRAESEEDRAAASSSASNSSFAALVNDIKQFIKLDPWSIESEHPLRQFTTPAEQPLSLEPSVF